MKKNIKSIASNILVMSIAVAIAIPAGRYLPKIYEKFKSHSKSGNFQEHVINLPYSVTLYGTSTCPHCKAAREYLHKAGVNFNDLVLDKNPALEKSFDKLGENSVPILVSNNRLVIGFVSDEYDDMLNISGKQPR